MTRTRFTAALAAFALASCNQGPPAKPIKQLMAEDVQPTAEVYWHSVQFVSELVDGKVIERDIRPQTDAEWEKVRRAAVEIGGFGELLQTGSYTEGRGDDWKQFAQGLVEVSKAAEAAAAAKDPDKVFEVGGTIYSVCKACHDVYPPAEGPGAAG